MSTPTPEQIAADIARRNYGTSTFPAMVPTHLQGHIEITVTSALQAERDRADRIEEDRTKQVRWVAELRTRAERAEFELSELKKAKQ